MEQFYNVLADQVENVSISVLLVTIILGWILVSCLYYLACRIKKKKMQATVMVTWYFQVISICMMFQLTLYSRLPDDKYGIVIKPFTNLFNIFGTIQMKYVAYAFYNMLLLFPYGFFWTLLKKDLPGWMRFISVTCISFLTSLGIEILQLIFHRGYFETEDLICNTLGGAAGCIVAVIIITIVHMIEHKENECLGEK